MVYVAGIDKNEEWDAIVIGAGLGGLTCANFLAKSGYKTLLLEKHSIPGGYCTNFKRKDFIFDASHHMTSGVGKDQGLYTILQSFDAENCVEWIPAKEIYRWKSPNLEFTVYPDLDKHVELLCKQFPEESEGIKKFYDHMQKTNNFLHEFSAQDTGGKIVMAIGKIGTLTKFLQSLKHTVTFLLDKYEIKNQELRGIICALYLFFGIRPDELSELTYNAGAITLLTKGAFYPKGGSGNFSEKLAQNFIKLGGKIEYNTEVTRILISDGIATGVETKKGNTYTSRVIISGIDANILYNQLIGNDLIPKDFLNILKARKPAKSIFEVWLGLDFDVKTKGIEGYEYVFQNSLLTTAEYNSILRDGDFNKMSEFLVTIYSNLDSTLCPSGKSIIAMACYAEYEVFQKYLENDGKTRGENYNKFKEKIMETLIDKLSKYLAIPDLKQHIEVKVAATPITFQRYTYNYSGSILGWELNPEQVAKNLPNQTPIKNIFHCGHWTNPGGSVMAVIISGYTTGTLVKKYLSK